MEEEAEQNSSEMICPEGITFYDLRPYFAATHYNKGPLPQNITLHMETCEPCRERWQFLIDTDPRLSEHYWQEIEELSSRLTERVREPELIESDVHKAIQDLRLEQEPKVELIYRAWRTVRSIENEESRQMEAEYLADVCRSLLEGLGKSGYALNRLMEIEQKAGTEPIAVDSVIDLLAIAEVAVTSFAGEDPVVEFRGARGYIYPERFRQARKYNQDMKAKARTEN